jgi:hypothetical protein
MSFGHETIIVHNMLSISAIDVTFEHEYVKYFPPGGEIKNTEVSFTIFSPNIAVISFLIGDQLPPPHPHPALSSVKRCVKDRVLSVNGSYILHIKRANRVCSY